MSFRKKNVSTNKVLEDMIKKKQKEIDYFATLKENCITDKGIGEINPFYIMCNPFLDTRKIYESIYSFILSYKKKYIVEHNLNEEDVDVKFINYGDIELVYLLEDKKNNIDYTLLVKQPDVIHGFVKKEHDNLIELSKRADFVVAPIDYYCNEECELYVTPYIPYARCIATDNVWGMYVPEPYYRFEKFTDDQESIVNTCIIAKLVSLYDFNKRKGIAACRIGGGDFMLKQGWENEELTIKNTLDSLYLIALRNTIDCEFEEYLNLIRKEFSNPLIVYLDAKINTNNMVKIKEIDLKNGIELGCKMINYKK